MLHPFLSLLLIGTTLLGPAMCCCAMNVLSVATTDSPSCCCLQDDSTQTRPTNSDNKKRHDCPCRTQIAVGMIFDDIQRLTTSSLQKWAVKLSHICVPVFFLSGADVALHPIRLSRGRSDLMPTGAELLIAHCVHRC